MIYNIAFINQIRERIQFFQIDLFALYMPVGSQEVERFGRRRRHCRAHGGRTTDGPPIPPSPFPVRTLRTAEIAGMVVGPTAEIANVAVVVVANARRRLFVAI